jgi:hypothetical protein
MKPHRNLKVYTRKEATFRLAQSVLRAANRRGTLRWNSRYSEKYYGLEIYHAQARLDAPFGGYFENVDGGRCLRGLPSARARKIAA